MARLKVVIADDHPLVLDAVCASLEEDDDVEVVGKAASARELLSLLAYTEPDVVLLDVSMPEMDGLACLDALRERRPKLRVVMLSGVEDPRVARQALQLGAAAFARKQIDPRDLSSVIRLAAEETLVAQVEAVRVGEDDSHEIGLTRSERAVLDALGRGLVNKQIATDLCLAQQTVKFHLTNIYRKLGVANRTEAIRFAYENGLLARVSRATA